MTAEPMGDAVWTPDPVKQRRAGYTVEDVLQLPDDPHYWRIEQDPLHVFAYDLIDGRYELAADSAEELVLREPFEIRLPIREIAP